MLNEIGQVEIERSKQVFAECLRSVLPALRRRGDDYIQKRVGKEKFEDSALELWYFMSEGTNKALTYHEEMALGVKLMACLANYVKQVLGLDLSVSTLVNSVSMLQAAADRAFPGYATSKLLRYVILPQIASEPEYMTA